MNPSPADRAGELVRRALPAQPRGSVVHARARLIEAAARERRRGRLVPLLAAAAVVVLLLVARRALSPGELTFAVAERPGKAGEHLVATHQPLSLHFSDGGEVRLETGSRARVAATTDRGASLVLEAGTVSLDIPHRPVTSWSVAAGPYSVLVKGTSFATSWDAASGTIRVVMKSGVVQVLGPGIDGAVEVRAGQSFEASEPAVRPTPSATSGPGASGATSATGATGATSEAPSGADAQGGAVSAAPAAVAAPVEPAGRARDERPGSPSPSAAHGGAGSWDSLLARGNYAAIVDEAERRGVPTVLRTADAPSLMALADAARLLGRAPVASSALEALRARFAGSQRARSAAFLLGRLADDRGAPQAAITWYDTYLSESPAGPLAAEALGRKMLALGRDGQHEAAATAARSYLARFPEGGYAAAARAIVPPPP